MKTAIIGQTIGTEIYEALHGGNFKVTIINDEKQDRIMTIENMSIYAEQVIMRPITRKERRKLARKK